jgi:glycosyltransferase involved in cell wall biosynthesis
MNVQFSGPTVGGTATLAGAARTRTLFLLTPTKEECGVESFARLVVEALQTSHPDDGYAVVAVSDRWRDLPSAFRQIAGADRVVFSVPLVAWKRVLLMPLAVLVFAKIASHEVDVFMHEWGALHWLRRLVLAPFVILSRKILVVSPFVADQLASGRWLGGARAKCRLVPNAPVVRPGQQCVTERVRIVRSAKRDCDIVIGHFGAIYQGKAATALLDVCDHLRSRGVRALIVFVGSFLNSIDDYERAFWDKVEALGLAGQVIVTGYVANEAELYTLFDEIGAFLFLFPEGLTARRSSVIHSLQSGRPVVVTAPRSMAEFAHHAGFAAVIEAGALSFIPDGADLRATADRLMAAAAQGRRTTPTIDYDAWWRATTAATHAALVEG